MIITVNGHTYNVGPRAYQVTRDIARNKFQKENVNAIYCVEKNDFAEMLKDVYTSKTEMNKTIKDYEAKGFKVYRTYKAIATGGK